MSRLHIIYSPSTNPSSRDLLHSLKKRDYSVTENSNLDSEVLPKTKADEQQVVFIYLEDDLKDAPQLDRLLKQKAFFKYPVIIFGSKIKDYVNSLKETFPLVMWINPAESMKDLFSTLSSLESDYSETSIVTQQISGESVIDDGIDSDSIFKSAPNIDFSKHTIGLQFTRTSNHSSFDPDQKIANETVREKFEDFIQKHTKKAAAHIKRVHITSTDVQNHIRLWNFEKSVLEAASTLYLASCDRRQLPIITGDYLQAGNNLQEKVAEQFLLSADLIRNDIAHIEASNVVEDMSQILLGKKSPSDNEQSEAASFLIGIDLLDRSCWRDGRWQVTHAKRLLNAVYEQKVSILSSRVSWTMIQLIVNAFENVHTVSKMIKKNQPEDNESNLTTRVQETNEQSGQAVTLSQLKPGMKLSKALCAKDGTEILPRNFILDEKLILRLWNLSAMRSIEQPCIK